MGHGLRKSCHHYIGHGPKICTQVHAYSHHESPHRRVAMAFRGSHRANKTERSHIHMAKKQNQNRAEKVKKRKCQTMRRKAKRAADEARACMQHSLSRQKVPERGYFRPTHS